MLVRIKASELKKIVGRVAPAIERRNKIPVLSCMCFEATAANELAVRGTNLDVWISSKGLADVNDKGAVLIDAGRMAAFLSKIPGDAQVTISKIEDDVARIATEANGIAFSWDYTPPLLPKELPSGPTGEPSWKWCRVDADELRTLLSRVVFAVSKEETRYYLNGVYLHRVDDNILSVATDGHRMAQVTRPANGCGWPVPENGAIVPNIAVKIILANLPKDGDNKPVDVAFDGDLRLQVRVGEDEFMVITKLVDGTYPDYARVIPDTTIDHSPVRFDRARAAHVFGLMSRVLPKAMPSARITIDSGAVSIETPNDHAEARAHARMAVHYSGTTQKVIGFNCGYMADVLKNLRGDVAEMWVQDGSSPAVFRSPDEPEFLIVQMPMRV